MSFNNVESDVVRWGEARGIVQNSTPMSQAVKTLEEVSELFDALNKNDIDGIKDAVGDIMVTLIMLCAVVDRDAGISHVNLVGCLKGAYEQIKHRKGYLTPQGIFVKE